MNLQKITAKEAIGLKSGERLYNEIDSTYLVVDEIRRVDGTLLLFAKKHSGGKQPESKRFSLQYIVHGPWRLRVKES